MSDPSQLPVVYDAAEHPDGVAAGYAQAFEYVFSHIVKKAEEYNHPAAPMMRQMSNLMVEAAKVLLEDCPESERLRIFNEMVEGTNNMKFGVVVTVDGTTVMISEKE